MTWQIQVCGHPDVTEERQKLIAELEQHLIHSGDTCAIEAFNSLPSLEDETLVIDAVVEVVPLEHFRRRWTKLHVSVLPEDQLAIQIAFEEEGALHLRNLDTYESDTFPSDIAHAEFARLLRARMGSTRTNRAFRAAHEMITAIEDQLASRS